MRRRSGSDFRSGDRRGALLICTLVCLLVSTSLVGILIHRAIRSRRHVHTLHQLRQTELLLDAGVLRAATRLQSDPQYSGELWEPSIAIEAFPNPTVTIRVDGTTSPAERFVAVTASLGDESTDDQAALGIATRRSHSFLYRIPSNPVPESSSAK